MARISAIAAIDRERGIGRDNKLLWNIPEDLKYFRAQTRGHAVIMGRKTYESIGRPLPKRVNIVVTHNPDFHSEGVIVVSSIEDAIKEAKKHESEEIFIIGGAQIYTQGLAHTNRLYLTLVEGEYGADAFFPDYSEFNKIISEEQGSSNGYSYKFVVRER